MVVSFPLRYHFMNLNDHYFSYMFKTRSIGNDTSLVPRGVVEYAWLYNTGIHPWNSVRHVNSALLGTKPV